MPRMEHREQADRLERDAGRLEEESGRIGKQIEEARWEWDAKQGDPSVPGAQPDPEEEAEPTPGVPGEEERGTGQEQDREEHGS